MAKNGRENTLRARLQKRWVSSLGVQSWLADGSRVMLMRFANHLAQELARDRRHTRGARGIAEFLKADGPLPKTVAEVRALIRHLEQTLIHLDDVDDYETIGDVDDDMYGLWKELERKMQMHRQSEAKFQLKGMFRI